MMVYFFGHVKIALYVGTVVVFGLLAANLVDLDHSYPRAGDWLRCGIKPSQQELQEDDYCLEKGERGIFHSVWFFIFMIALTVGVGIHLYLDGVFVG